MKIESQVCSLELAKRLKELGFKQDSLFYWEKCPDKNNDFVISNYEYHNVITGEYTDCHLLENQENYSAFTVAELGGMLPIKINDKYLTTHRCSRKGWWIFYSSEDEDDKSFNSYWDASSEANIRARMLIHLIEKNLVKVEDINK